MKYTISVVSVYDTTSVANISGEHQWWVKNIRWNMMFIYVDQLWEYAHKWYMYLIGECTLSNTHTHTHRRIRGEIARVKKKRKERERERGGRGSHRGAAMWWHEQVKVYQTNSTSELRLQNTTNKKTVFSSKTTTAAVFARSRPQLLTCSAKPCVHSRQNTPHPSVTSFVLLRRGKEKTVFRSDKLTRPTMQLEDSVP